MRVDHVHAFAELAYWFVVHSFVPSSGSRTVAMPTALPTRVSVPRQVVGAEPEITGVGGDIAAGASLARWRYASSEMSVVSLDAAAMMPELPAASTPTLG